MIGFIVSCFAYNNTGKGGHYYTVHTIFREIQKHRKAVLIVIGDFKPVAIDTSAEGVRFFRVGRTIKHEHIIKLTAYLRELNIQVLHAFDTYAFLFCRLATRFSNIRMVTTKCGGPPPHFHYYPDICPDTVFSAEDQAYFQRRAGRFKVKPPLLIPNRVSEPKDMKPSPDLKELPAPANPDSIKVLRIARIYRAYEKSIFQTIALTEALRANGLAVALYIVGYIQDMNTYKRVKCAMTSSDVLLTDDHYTRHASRHLKAVDIAVSTGRGVMEASIYEKIVMCSVHDSDYPFLLDATNMAHFFHYNFSSRAPKPDISEQRNLENLLKLLKDKKQKEQYHREMKAINDRYFDISTAVPSYLRLYETRRQARPALIEALDLWVHRSVSVAKLGLRKLQYTRGLK